MARKMHPNSLKNLEKRRKFSSEDGSARECGQKSQAARRKIAEEFKALMYEESPKDGSTRAKVLAAKLIMNMEKSPQWYELGLKMLGEMPKEEIKVEVGTGDCEETKQMIAELKNHVKGRGNPDNQ